MGDKPVILYDRKMTPIILPAGTAKVEIPTAYPTNNQIITYVCPDGDLIQVDRYNGKIRNASKGIDLGEI